MTPKEKQIKEFYDTITFPGLYKSIDVVEYGDYLIYERYLRFYQDNDVTTVLDIGCGSGFVTNVIAYNNPHLKITAIDFSDTIEHGKKIAKELGIKNIKWVKANFLTKKFNNTYDVVFANGSLHHMPEYKTAVEKAKSLTHNFLLVGLYNKYGKWIQRNIVPKFSTVCFELDQMSIPFELSFTHNQSKKAFKEFKLVKVTPSIFGVGVDFVSLFRGKWGGFTFYTFKR
jgi:SAM-dependent methyltransferase